MAHQEGNCSGNTNKKIVFFLALYHGQKGKSLKESRKGLNSLSLVHTFIFVSTHSLPLDSVFDLFTFSLIFFLFLLCCHLASGFPLASLNGFSSSPPFSQLTMNSSLSPQSLASSLTQSQMLFIQLSYVSFAWMLLIMGKYKLPCLISCLNIAFFLYKKKSSAKVMCILSLYPYGN